MVQGREPGERRLRGFRGGTYTGLGLAPSNETGLADPVLPRSSGNLDSAEMASVISFRGSDVRTRLGKLGSEMVAALGRGGRS